MRAATLILVLLVLPGAAAQAEWSFLPPAQVEGEAEASGLSWALLVFRDGAHADVEAGAVEYTNHTQARLRSTVAAGMDVPQPLPPSRQEFDAVDADLEFPGWSSLLVVAQEIRVASAGSGEIVGFPGNASTARGFLSSLPPGVFRDAVLHDVDREAGLWLQGDAAFHVEASGARVLEWHGARVACRSQDCPDGGGTTSVRQDAGGGHVLGQLHSYARLEGPSTVAAGGVLHGFVAGSDGFRLGLDGRVRLPVARAMPECGCYDPAERTATLEGNVSLEGLRYAGSHISAEVGGNVSLVRLDEVVGDPARILGGKAWTVAAAGAGLGLGWLLWRSGALAALFTRVRRSDALGHPVRSGIHDVVEQRPGVDVRGLEEATGTPRGTLRHHLDKMVELGLLRVRRHRGRLRYFSGQHHPEEAMAGDPDARRLLAWLRRREALRQRDIVAWGARLGWSRSKAQNVVCRLVEAGQVRSWKNGGRWYEAQSA